MSEEESNKVSKKRQQNAVSKKTLEEEAKPSSGSKITGLHWLYLLGLVIVTYFVFSPGLENGFVNWDDDIYVTKNGNVQQGFSMENSKKFFNDTNTFKQVFNYHPLTMISLSLDFDEKDPSNASSFHGTSLFFHLLNVILIFIFIHILTRGKAMIALITAMFFAIHPMHVESVAWVAERKDVLFTFFFFAGLISYLWYLRKNDWKFLVAAVVLCYLSIISKPTALVFPIVLIIIDLYERRDLLINKYWIFDKLPFFGLAVWLGMKTLDIQAGAGATAMNTKFGIGDKIVLMGYSFFDYFKDFFVPSKVAVYHPYPESVVAESASFPTIYYVFLLCSILLVAGVIWTLKKTRIVAVGMLFFLVTMSLTLHIISIGNVVTSDRYTYVPYIGIAFIIGYAYHYLAESKEAKHKVWKNVLLGGIAVYGVVFSIMSFNLTQTWKDGDTLWTRVIEVHPDSHWAYTHRGTYKKSIGDVQGAMEDFNSSIKVNKGFYMAYGNRGNIYFNEGMAFQQQGLVGKANEKFDIAMADYEQSIKLQPKGNATAYSSRGAVYAMRKEYDKSILDLNEAIKQNPGMADAYKNRGAVYAFKEDFASAKLDHVAYLRFSPGDDAVHNSLGVDNQQLELHQEAIGNFTSAIQYCPAGSANKGTYYLNRSASYNATGDLNGALADAVEAQRLGADVNQNYLSALRQALSK
jgi:tetratricopeptide (TPR) repeat protein